MSENNHLPINATETPESGASGENATNTDPLNQFLDHQRKAFEETGKAIDALLPDGFKEHSKEAQREFIKGMKVLVDAAVEGLEKASRDVDRALRQRGTPAATPPASDDRPSSTGAQKVKVRVD